MSISQQTRSWSYFKERVRFLGKSATMVVILWITFAVVLNYVDYFPPNLESEFLLGRSGYFWGSYQWAFYCHILASPFALPFGLFLLNDKLRMRFPLWHRRIGKTQVLLVLLLVAPSGLWMAFYADSNAVLGFVVMSVATGVTAAMGWITAVRRQFLVHRRWMWRNYLLLTSAVTIRVINTTAIRLDWPGDWIYPFSAWASWLVPLMIFEGLQSRRRSKPMAPRAEIVSDPQTSLDVPAPSSFRD